MENYNKKYHNIPKEPNNQPHDKTQQSKDFLEK